MWKYYTMIQYCAITPNSTFRDFNFYLTRVEAFVGQKLISKINLVIKTKIINSSL